MTKNARQRSRGRSWLRAGQQHPVVRLKNRPLHASTQYRQLMAQHDDLQLFGALATGEQHD